MSYRDEAMPNWVDENGVSHFGEHNDFVNYIGRNTNG